MKRNIANYKSLIYTKNCRYKIITDSCRNTISVISLYWRQIWMSSTNYNFVVCLHLRLRWSGSGSIVCPQGCTWKSHLKNRKVILILCKTGSNTQISNFFCLLIVWVNPEKKTKTLLDLHSPSVTEKQSKSILIRFLFFFRLDLSSLTTMHDGSFLM